MKKIFTSLFIFLLTGVTIQAQTYYAENGDVTFYSKVPLHNFEGISSNLVGLINTDTKIVDFYIDLETLKTGNGKRDKDMLITLKTDLYPFAEFYGELTSDFDPSSKAEQNVAVSGSFTIHGITNSVEVEGTLTPTDEGLLLKAGWFLSLDDYDIKPPKLLIVKVDDQQEIEIEILLPAFNEDSK